MNAKQYKEQVREALSRIPKSIEITDIAEEIGVHRDRLYNFGSKGYLNRDDLSVLAEWLRDNGYLEEAERFDPPLDDDGDALDLFRLGLLYTLRTLRVEPRDRATKARIAIEQIEELMANVGPGVRRLFEDRKDRS